MNTWSYSQFANSPLCNMPMRGSCIPLSASQPLGDLLVMNKGMSSLPVEQSLQNFYNKKMERPIPAKPSNPLRYKTEMCRAFEEGMLCRFGESCTFAHGVKELRPIPRHPRYKTEICRTYHTRGVCQYGTRCHFIHALDENVHMRLSNANMLSKEKLSTLGKSSTNDVFISNLFDMLNLRSNGENQNQNAVALVKGQNILTNPRLFETQNLGSVGASTLGSSLPDTSNIEFNVEKDVNTQLDKFLWNNENENLGNCGEGARALNRVKTIPYIDQHDEYFNNLRNCRMFQNTL